MAQSQLTENLLGALDVMLSRSTGMKRIDLTPEGFWNSFYGLLITALVDMIALSLSHPTVVSRMGDAAPEKFYFVFGNLTAALVGYASAMLALFLLCRSESEARGFPTSLAVHNWASPVISMAILPIIFITELTRTQGQTGVLETFLMISIIAALIVAGIRILRISLLLTPGRASAYFAITTLVSLSISQGLEGIMGL
ncbi:MAG: hypothetical protein AAF890_03470 [Pseudomonadota bacterium]